MVLAQLAGLLLPLLPIQDPTDPVIAMQYRAGLIHFAVEWERPPQPFLAAVILSMDSNRCIQFEGMPPLLCNYSIVGAGVAESVFHTHILEHLLPPGFFLYAQGVVADERMVRTTQVIEFILDASPPHGGTG